MDALRNSFLVLSIKNQILSGVITVSICVCILVLISLAVNCFILINLSYIDLVGEINEIDTNELRGVATHIDLSLTMGKEASKIAVQWNREIIENFQSMPDITSSIKSSKTNWKESIRNYEDVLKNPNIHAYECSQLQYNCILYRELYQIKPFNYDRDLEDFLFNKYISLPMLHSSMRFRLYELSKLELFDNFVYLNKKLLVYYIYPFRSINDFNTIDKTSNTHSSTRF